jgi:hypothetical protein
MAKYTVELNDIVKSGFKLFDFDYPFYDNTKKPEFETRFIEHFRFYEIGVETVARFQHNLKVTFNEKLPYYNKILETSLYEYDIKNNYNLTETFTKTNSKLVKGNANQTGISNTDVTQDMTETNNKSNEVNSNIDRLDNSNIDKTANNINNNKNVESDTPNGLLSMEDIKTNIFASKALLQDGTTEVTEKQISAVTSNDKSLATGTETAENVVEGTTSTNNDFSSETDTETTESGNESYTLERVGDIGVDTTPDKIKKHLEIQKILTTVYINFFDECNDLFMQLY